MFTVLLFLLFAGLAIGCAISMVAQRNPLYSAISLIGVFIALACLYVMLAAPFIAAVQVIVYAGAIMVLVVFVIMLLNVEEEEKKRTRLRVLIPAAVLLAAVLIAEASFIFYFVERAGQPHDPSTSNVGLTASIGIGLFTQYLLPFEITSVLLLMAIVGAMTLASRTGGGFFSPNVRVVPGAAVLPRQIVDPNAVGDATPVIAETTEEAARLLGVDDVDQKPDED
ncbi:MAG TPA: NADH-quinone oxidoreductase subunit J [Pyrinomonadaceae bacterium]|nr:NADH-quinone oxidoreductase subunit J [Pyrinomonadaceae bacterium]